MAILSAAARWARPRSQGKNSRCCLYVVTKRFDNKVSKTAGIHIAYNNYNIFFEGVSMSVWNEHLSTSIFQSQNVWTTTPSYNALANSFLSLPRSAWKLARLPRIQASNDGFVVCIPFGAEVFPQPWNSDFVASVGSPRPSIFFQTLSKSGIFHCHASSLVLVFMADHLVFHKMHFQLKNRSEGGTSTA